MDTCVSGNMIRPRMLALRRRDQIVDSVKRLIDKQKSQIVVPRWPKATTRA